MLVSNYYHTIRYIVNLSFMYHSVTHRLVAVLSQAPMASKEGQIYTDFAASLCYLRYLLVGLYRIVILLCGCSLVACLGSSVTYSHADRRTSSEYLDNLAISFNRSSRVNFRSKGFAISS